MIMVKVIVLGLFKRYKTTIILKSRYFRSLEKIYKMTVMIKSIHFRPF